MHTVALTPALLAVGAREIPLYGHHPLLLSAPDRVWIVASGEADVVTSQVADGIPVGYRAPVFKGGSGTPLFPLHQHLLTDGEGLLVNTSSPVVLYEVSVEYAADLFALFGLSVKDAIENWAPRIARFCGREEIVSGALRFPQDGELSLLADKRVAVRPGEMVWVRVTQGQLHAFGEADLALTPNTDFMPLGGDIWFDLPAPAAVTVSPDLATRRPAICWRGWRS